MLLNREIFKQTIEELTTPDELGILTIQISNQKQITPYEQFCQRYYDTLAVYTVNEKEAINRFLMIYFQNKWRLSQIKDLQTIETKLLDPNNYTNEVITTSQNQINQILNSANLNTLGTGTQNGDNTLLTIDNNTNSIPIVDSLSKSNSKSNSNTNTTGNNNSSTKNQNLANQLLIVLQNGIPALYDAYWSVYKRLFNYQIEYDKAVELNELSVETWQRILNDKIDEFISQIDLNNSIIPRIKIELPHLVNNEIEPLIPVITQGVKDTIISQSKPIIKQSIDELIKTLSYSNSIQSIIDSEDFKSKIINQIKSNFNYANQILNQPWFKEYQFTTQTDKFKVLDDYDKQYDSSNSNSYFTIWGSKVWYFTNITHYEIKLMSRGIYTIDIINWLLNRVKQSLPKPNWVYTDAWSKINQIYNASFDQLQLDLPITPNDDRFQLNLKNYATAIGYRNEDDKLIISHAYDFAVWGMTKSLDEIKQKTANWQIFNRLDWDKIINNQTDEPTIYNLLHSYYRIVA